MIHTDFAEKCVAYFELARTPFGWTKAGAMSIKKRPKTGVALQFREERGNGLFLVYYKDCTILELEELDYTDEGFDEGCRKIAILAKMGLAPTEDFKYEGN